MALALLLRRAVDCLVNLCVSVARSVRFPLKRLTQAIKPCRLRHTAFASLSSCPLSSPGPAAADGVFVCDPLSMNGMNAAGSGGVKLAFMAVAKSK